VNALTTTGIVRSDITRSVGGASGVASGVPLDSLEAVTSAGTKLRTSQLALPAAVSRRVYGTSGYGASLANLAQTSLSGDMVFSDGYSLQMADVSGSADSWVTATLNVPV
jgi:hypothetical protein